jgi:phage terminase large subunit-like protein
VTVTLGADQPRTGWEAAARRFETTTAAAEDVTPLAVGMQLDRRLIRTPALDMVGAAVVDWFTGRHLRQIVVLPPQEGKTLSARYGCMQGLRHDPMLRFAVASYSDRMARRVPRWVRNDIRAYPTLGLRLAPDQRAAHDWRLENGVGGMYAAGVGGSWSGEPVDRLLLDDLFKDRKAADSPVARDTVQDWWKSTGSTRLSEGGAVLVINTRWHHDDLIGYLLANEPGEWRVLHIPAQADPKVMDPDPLGRAPGEFLVSARGRTPASWAKRKRSADDEWGPVYQGAPVDPGGETFDIDKLAWWHLTPDGRGISVGPGMIWNLSECYRFATIDTATSTSSSADWTVASAWAVPPDGTLVLLDVRRGRVPEHKQIDLARPLAQRWALDVLWVEATMAGTRLVRAAVNAGLRIGDLKADRAKTVRAALAAQWVDQGRVWFPAPASPGALPAQVLEDVLEELRQFPSGRHDDFVDTLAYAAAVTWEQYSPPVSGREDRPLRSVHDRLVDTAVGGQPLDDLMTRPM